MKTEVSKMTSLLTVTRERELSRVLLHQVLESPERHNLPQRHMHRLRPRFYTQNGHGLVRQTGVQPYRCQRHRHVFHLDLCIYNLAESYVHVKEEKPGILDSAVATVTALVTVGFSASKKPTDRK